MAVAWEIPHIRRHSRSLAAGGHSIKYLGQWLLRQPVLAAILAYLFVSPVFSGLILRKLDLIEMGLFFLCRPCDASFSARFHATVGHLRNYTFCGDCGYTSTNRTSRFVRCRGRLSALAYADSWSVRFGSILDDPNGFGLLLALFLGYTFEARQRLRTVRLILLFACLILTQSITAIISVIAAVALYLVVRSDLRIKKSTVVTGLGLIMVLGIFTMWVVIYWHEVAMKSETVTLAYDALMAQKSASAEDHIGGWSTLVNHADASTILGVHSLGYLGEPGYANLLGAFGGFYLLSWLLLGVLAIVCYARIVRSRVANRESRAVAGAAFCFLSAIYIGAFNLPTPSIFPLDILTAIFIGLITSEACKASGPEVRGVSARELIVSA